MTERFTKISIRYNEKFILIRVENLQREALQLLNTKIQQLESDNLYLAKKLNNTIHGLYLRENIQ